jgi:predicted nucleotidyltransferase
MALTLQDIDRALQVLVRNGATKVILFGRAASSLQEARDLDLACSGIEGWDLYRVAAELEQELPVTVDLVPLTPGDRFSEYIVKKGRVLHGQT